MRNEESTPWRNGAPVSNLFYELSNTVHWLLIFHAVVKKLHGFHFKFLHKNRDRAERKPCTFLRRRKDRALESLVLACKPQQTQSNEGGKVMNQIMIQCLANNNDIMSHLTHSKVSSHPGKHSLTRWIKHLIKYANTCPNRIKRRGSLAHSFAGTGIGRIGSAELGSLY